MEEVQDGKDRGPCDPNYRQPADPAGDEASIGKEAEHKKEDDIGQITQDQGRCARWRETLLQAIRNIGCPHHHQQEGNQQGHPIVGLAPEDDRRNCKAHEHGENGECDGDSDGNASERKGLRDLSSLKSNVPRKEHEEDGQREDDKYDPGTACNDELTTM
jgi:hypothetical protein